MLLLYTPCIWVKKDVSFAKKRVLPHVSFFGVPLSLLLWGDVFYGWSLTFQPYLIIDPCKYIVVTAMKTPNRKCRTQGTTLHVIDDVSLGICHFCGAENMRARDFEIFEKNPQLFKSQSIRNQGFLDRNPFLFIQQFKVQEPSSK